jgi:hypothetical protein
VTSVLAAVPNAGPNSLAGARSSLIGAIEAERAAAGTLLTILPTGSADGTISSIFALTPASWRAGASEARAGCESSRREEPRAAICSLDRPSRRTLRSMSNSRLRTKSFRRLRSIIAFSSPLA